MKRGWHSRAHRNAGSGRRIAVLFALGSVCFAAASIASQWAAAPRPWIGVTFFAGSLLFTAGGYGQFRGVSWEQGRIEWLAAVVQLAGTLFFNVSTFHALQRGLSTEQTLLRVWTPDVFGSICFLVSSGLAYSAVCRRWFCVRLRDGEWRVARPQPRRIDRVRRLGDRLAGRAVDGRARERCDRERHDDHRRVVLPDRCAAAPARGASRARDFTRPGRCRPGGRPMNCG
jgi:hypothetical protein